MKGFYKENIKNFPLVRTKWTTVMELGFDIVCPYCANELHDYYYSLPEGSLYNGLIECIHCNKKFKLKLAC